MATEEFSSKSQEFWYIMGKVMSFFPVIALVGCIIAYCVGSSRENYIKQYKLQISYYFLDIMLLWLIGLKEVRMNLRTCFLI